MFVYLSNQSFFTTIRYKKVNPSFLLYCCECSFNLRSTALPPVKLLKHYLNYLMALQNNSTYLSGGGLSTQGSTQRNEPIYYQSYRQHGPASIAQGLTSTIKWRPPSLPFLRGNHPIEALISTSSCEQIIVSCQQPLDNSLVHITKSRLTSMTT